MAPNVARIHGRTWDATDNRTEAHRGLQEIKHGNWLAQLIGRHFVFPKGEFALVGENGQRISLPTPLLGALIALFVWLAGGTLAGVWLVATISANVQNMNNTFIQYQMQTESQKKAMQEKIDLLELKVAAAREKVIRLDERKKGG